MKFPLTTLFFILLFLSNQTAISQNKALNNFLADSSLLHASVSLCIIDAGSGAVVSEFNPGKSLAPASVMKLITSGTALELLRPDFRFTTTLGYTGTLNPQTGRLKGDLIIHGGGDPALGSKYFEEHYGDFAAKWVSEIKRLGIKKVEGRIISDDSYYDYQPVPAKWPWEDLGNYYGAGVYGLSAYDNTARLHFKTGGPGSQPVLVKIEPEGYKYDYKNMLTADGDTDEGYAFTAPYSSSGWISGTIPVNTDDFVLKASIADPPLFLAQQLNDMLSAEGIKTSGVPTAVRLMDAKPDSNITSITTTFSPPLSELIEVLNHESVNLFAEALLKQLGKSFRNSGSVAAGLAVLHDFLLKCGINTDGLFIEDGSGLSPKDALTSEGLARFLFFMRNSSTSFREYYASLPEAGKEGTLKYCFRDPVFSSRLRAKSGSMERVRCYAGYFTTKSEKEMIFTILVNNFTGSSQKIITGIENLLGETIAYK